MTSGPEGRLREERRLYVYAICGGSETPLFGRLGLQDEPVFYVSAHGLTAAVSRFRGSVSPQPDAEDVWRHELVVEELCEHRAVLPARYGTLVGEAQLKTALAEGRSVFRQALDKVSGRVELGLRVLWEPADQTSEDDVPPNRSSTPSSGREYLLRRLAEDRRTRAGREAAEQKARAVCQALDRLAAESTLQFVPTSGLLLSAAFLVDRSAVDEFRRELMSVRAEYDELQFLCTGPWPPYSFAMNGAFLGTAGRGGLGG